MYRIILVILVSIGLSGCAALDMLSGVASIIGGGSSSSSNSKGHGNDNDLLYDSNKTEGVDMGDKNKIDGSNAKGDVSGNKKETNYTARTINNGTPWWQWVLLGSFALVAWWMFQLGRLVLRKIRGKLNGN